MCVRNELTFVSERVTCNDTCKKDAFVVTVIVNVLFLQQCKYVVYLYV